MDASPLPPSYSFRPPFPPRYTHNPAAYAALRSGAPLDPKADGQPLSALLPPGAAPEAFEAALSRAVAEATGVALEGGSGDGDPGAVAETELPETQRA